ncbi:MAG: hypothetical protein MJY59_00230 [Bacteroidaceae bacterium]|nr:hypothetical protein [Bacteroidaceae bacterium]
MRIILQDHAEELAFQVYARQIGIPIGKWYEDTWVSAFCVVKGLSRGEALRELQERETNYRPCCCL